MEKREELKDGVKQRLIEFMADQIVKEESFTELKNELIGELLVKKEIVAPVQENLSRVLDSSLGISPENDRERNYKEVNGFVFNSEVVEKRLSDLKKERTTEITPGGSFSSYLKAMDESEKKRENISTEKGFQIPQTKQVDKFNTISGFQLPDKKDLLESVKRGKTPRNLTGFLEDFSNSPDAAQVVKSLKSTMNKSYDPALFDDYSFKYQYSEAEKVAFRLKIMELLKNENNKLSVDSFHNGANYYKKFNVTTPLIEDKVHTVLNISFIYNNITKAYFIDNFNCVIDSRFMMNHDLGLELGVEVLLQLGAMEKNDNQELEQHVFRTKRVIKKTPKKVVRYDLNKKQVKAKPAKKRVNKTSSKATKRK